MDEQIQRYLKRVALAGRWDELRSLLAEYIENNPQDIEAKAEMQRLQNGQTMRLMLPAAERRKANAEDALNALEWMMDDHPQSSLKLCNKDELEQLLNELELHQQTLKKAGEPLPESAKQYKSALKSRIGALNGRASRKIAKRIIVGISAITAISAIWYSMDYRAHARYRDLKEALATPIYDNVLDSMRAAESNINRFFCSELSATIDQAEQWLQQQEKQYKKLDATLSQLESRKKTLTSLSPAEILELENGIDQSQRGRDNLLKRWQSVCKREYVELRAHKAAILQQLEQPLPLPPELSGDFQADTDNLKAHEESLSHRLKEMKAVISLYDISTHICDPIEAEIGKTNHILQSIKQLSYQLRRLPECRNYAAYCRAIKQLNCDHYPQANTLLQVQELLPTLESVTYHFSAPAGDISADLLVAAEQVLVHGAPSFSQKFPADQTVLQLPVDLFTAPSYNEKVYVLNVSDTETWYSTIRPEIDKTNFITYRRSSVDPRFSPENYYKEFQNDDTYRLTEIDATNLLRDLRLEHNSFFLHQNIPQLLTRVLNYQEGKHPALAQAYLYLCLLKITDAHPYPLLSGVRFSPTLKAHSASFIELLRRSKINLRPGCWLSTDAAVARAEQAFADWFRTNRGHDYAAEMAENFRKTYSASAVFCGYINENHRPVLFKTPKKGAAVLYVSAAGLTQDETQALPLSPIFTDKNAQ